MDLSKLPCPEGYEWRAHEPTDESIVLQRPEMAAVLPGPGDHAEAHERGWWGVERGPVCVGCAAYALLHRAGRDEPVRWAEPPGGWGGMGLRYLDEDEAESEQGQLRFGVVTEAGPHPAVAEVVLPDWPAKPTGPADAEEWSGSAQDAIAEIFGLVGGDESNVVEALRRVVREPVALRAVREQANEIRERLRVGGIEEGELLELVDEIADGEVSR